MFKELLTINCQGTNHPRSILSFMDISIPAVCLSRCRHTLSIPFRRVQRPRPRRPQGPAHAGRTGRGTEAEWGETWEASDRRPPGGRNGASSVSPSLPTHSSLLPSVVTRSGTGVRKGVKHDECERHASPRKVERLTSRPKRQTCRSLPIPLVHPPERRSEGGRWTRRMGKERLT